MSDWYLIYSKSRQEGVAARGLEEQGYRVYLPKILSKRRRKGLQAEIEQPLFPRYVFFRPGRKGQLIRPAQFTGGVQKLVKFGAEFLPVPDAVVESLRSHEDPETGYHTLDFPAIAKGDKVRIASGAFEGIEGIFKERKGQDRVVLLLNLLGGQTEAVVPIDELDR